MKVLDLFAGLKGWSAPFKERGHEIKTLDLEPKFECDLTMDILDFDSTMLEDWRPDIILASPPCNAFSVASLGHHWTGGKRAYIPKTEFAVTSQEIVKKTLAMIQELNPSFWILENPMGMLRKMKFMKGRWEKVVVTYCQYGEKWMKPTDLWGGFPPSLRFRPRCKNGDTCHEAAPRGTKTGGIQGVRGSDTAALRAVIPYELALDVCLATENDMKANKRYRPPMTLEEFII